MRPFLLAVLLALVLALGFTQVVSDGLARRAAQSISLVNFAPRPASGLLFEPAQQLLAAREAVQAGDVPAAREAIARLPPSRERTALKGGLAERAGDLTTAATCYLAAGAYESAEGIVERLDQTGARDAARRLQNEVLAGVRDDTTHLDAYAEAWWELGKLDSERGAMESDARSSQAGLVDYQHAHALAPFNQKYMLSAAYQALSLNDVDLATGLFRAAYDADPTNVHALAALGGIALRRGDASAARSYLARAQRLNATSPDVEQLAHRLPE
ncbi:MAG TPA: tetratricopeptide repeat protein [Candidatus Baltobacteraceae bacterium]